MWHQAIAVCEYIWKVENIKMSKKEQRCLVCVIFGRNWFGKTHGCVEDNCRFVI